MAAAWEFNLPLTPADLLRDGGPGHYVVQEVLTIRELPPALTGMRSPLPAPRPGPLPPPAHGRDRMCPRVVFPTPRRPVPPSPPLSVFSRSFPDRLPGAGRAGSAAALRLRLQLAPVSTGRRARSWGHRERRGWRRVAERLGRSGAHASPWWRLPAALTHYACPAATSKLWGLLSGRMPWS